MKRLIIYDSGEMIGPTHFALFLWQILITGKSKKHNIRLTIINIILQQILVKEKLTLQPWQRLQRYGHTAQVMRIDGYCNQMWHTLQQRILYPPVSTMGNSTLLCRNVRTV